MNLGCTLGVPTWIPRKLGLGPELVQNGAFDALTIWTTGLAWSIFGGTGVRVPDIAPSGISQPVSLIAGRTYRVTYTVSGYVAGVLTAQFTGGVTRSGADRSANGTYTEDLLANTGNTSLQILASSVANALIDSVSCREVMT